MGFLLTVTSFRQKSPPRLSHFALSSIQYIAPLTKFGCLFHFLHYFQLYSNSSYLYVELIKLIVFLRGGIYMVG